MESLGLQAVALSDGSTAYIEQAIKDGNLVEGDTIQLEDGTTAYIQQVTVQQKEPLPFEDGQAVQLEDGTTAYIHHTPKDGYDPSAVEAVQLEDGSTAYIHHPSGLQTGSTILTLQPGGGLEELATDDTVDTDTITTLENYAKMTGSEVEVDETMSSTNGLQDIEPIVQVMGSWGSPKGQQTAEKTFRCDYEGCGRLYTTAHHLKVHERAHTGVRPYRCDVLTCGKAFATGYGLKSHLRTHTGEKPYKCPEDMCFKAFKTSGDLQKHVRTHTGEKPYLCTVPGCGKRFTEYSSLYKHHVVHTHCKPYTCNHCGKTYRQTSTLAMHKRTTHGDFEATEDGEEAVDDQSQASFLEGAEQKEDGSDSQVIIGSQVGLSTEDLQALSTAITMVTQDGTTISLPTHQTDMAAMGHHHITMVTGEGKELQPVAIVTSEGIMTGGLQGSGPHYQQVALLATANGTQIAVQLEEQQTLEEAISMATAAIQQGGLVQDEDT
nr:zinc finger protein 76-like [Oncorhynchus nerka]XP_029538104.1 zinc finger protein 76-like [Oncorhynchus nerka]